MNHKYVGWPNKYNIDAPSIQRVHPAQRFACESRYDKWKRNNTTPIIARIAQRVRHPCTIITPRAACKRQQTEASLDALSLIQTGDCRSLSLHTVRAPNPLPP